MTERTLATICAERNLILGSVTCALDVGHSGMHKARAPEGRVYSWTTVAVEPPVAGPDIKMRVRVRR